MIAGMTAGYFEFNKLMAKRPLFFLGLLPHGIFGLAGILLIAAMGMIRGAGTGWVGYGSGTPQVFRQYEDFVSLFPLCSSCSGGRDH